MKVWIVTERIDYGDDIRWVCATETLAKQIASGLPYQSFKITEWEIIS